MLVWLAPRVARCLLELALGVIVFGLAIVVAAVWLGTLPVRRLRSSNPGRAKLEAAQAFGMALAGLVAALRQPPD